MIHEDETRWGISTGAACPGMELDQAVRHLLPFGPQVVELCPGKIPVTSRQLNELNRIKDGEGIVYTVHMAKSYMPGDPNIGGAEWFRAQNRPSVDVARVVKPLWVVHHPPITPYGNVSATEIAKFLSLVQEYQLPVLLETGVFRRDNKSNPSQVTSVEACRAPEDFVPFLKDPVVGIVADVPKMARSRELPAMGRKSLADITVYATECKALSIPVRQMHIIGADFWPEDHQFAQHALDQMKLQGIKPDTLIIESYPSRLQATVDLVKSNIAA